jgi:hypothetical protein
MQENPQINSLVMKTVLMLIPVFAGPALIAVLVIKRLDISGAMALLPVTGALCVSWLIVLRMQVWGRNSVRNIIRK